MNEEPRTLDEEKAENIAPVPATGPQMTPSKEAKKGSLKKDISWGLIALIFALLVCVRFFVAEPFLVYGSSMEPTFETGDYVIVDELTYKLQAPKRGDVVVLIPPNDPTKHYIKRILGLPGETIVVKGSDVTIYNKDHPQSSGGLKLNEPYIKFPSTQEATYTLTNSQYFVMGDNRAVSFDSRSWGPLPAANITGKVLLRLYPFSEIGILPGSTNSFK